MTETPTPDADVEALATAREADELPDFDLSRRRLAGGEFPGVKFVKRDLSKSNFTGANLEQANLKDAIARRTIFTDANLTKANLTGADLRGTDFLAADLRGADLRGAWLNKFTKLKHAKVAGAKIDRAGLLMLGVEAGGLTVADIDTMEVDDDFAKLTMGFGGFWTAIHMLATIIFLSPYVVFGFRKWLVAHAVSCTASTCEPLRTALWEYAISGGGQSNVDVLGALLFALILAYNVCRVALIYKARTLELKERATGRASNFRLTGFYRVAYHAVHVLVWVNLGLALYHGYELLDTPVPV